MRPGFVPASVAINFPIRNFQVFEKSELTFSSSAHARVQNITVPKFCNAIMFGALHLRLLTAILGVLVKQSGSYAVCGDC